jgi:hypothetical protein
LQRPTDTRCHAGRHKLKRTWLTESDLRVAAHARRVKVYVYDLAAAGFQPPLHLMNATSCACACGPVVPKAFALREGMVHEVCNEMRGKLHARRFARAFQGNYWGNHDFGKSAGGVMHARLVRSYRRCADGAACALLPECLPG